MKVLRENPDVLFGYILGQVSYVLDRFSFEKNDPDTRDRVFKSLRSIFSRILTGEDQNTLAGVSIVCDDKNNPKSIIKKNCLVVDISFLSEGDKHPSASCVRRELHFVVKPTPPPALSVFKRVPQVRKGLK